ncbi:MerR family transcriptional regulator [bacterium]|nr:MAG: MerR family transcriptional regulator [bacterium]
MAQTVFLGEKVTETFSIQEVARRSGFSEPTLRYYERVGLIASIPRDPSSGHRRYDADTVQMIEALACLRSCGFSISEMQTYLDFMAREHEAAAEQRELFEKHAAKLAYEIERLQVRQRYMNAKVNLWGARERRDKAAENLAIGELKQIAGELK